MTLYINVCCYTSAREYARDVNEIYSILFHMYAVWSGVEWSGVEWSGVFECNWDLHFQSPCISSVSVLFFLLGKFSYCVL
jgi:hypothetical protein